MSVGCLFSGESRPNSSRLNLHSYFQPYAWTLYSLFSSLRCVFRLGTCLLSAAFGLKRIFHERMSTEAPRSIRVTFMAGSSKAQPSFSSRQKYWYWKQSVSSKKLVLESIFLIWSLHLNIKRQIPEEANSEVMSLTMAGEKCRMRYMRPQAKGAERFRETKQDDARYLLHRWMRFPRKQMEMYLGIISSPETLARSSLFLQKEKQTCRKWP